MFKILTLTIIIVSSVLAEEWQIDKKGNNQVVFHSSTTLLDFEGTTDRVDGYIYLKDDSLFEGQNTVYFEVLPAFFKTGIGKRDSDMRSDVLETDKFPVASFKGKVVHSDQQAERTNVLAKGELKLHGVVKPITVQATIRRNHERLFIESNFSVLLKDYNIAAPTLMAFVKVAQEIKINVRLKMIKVK